MVSNLDKEMKKVVKLGFERVPFRRNRLPPWRGGALRCGVGAIETAAETTSELSWSTMGTVS